jgi:hypothetical protein
MHPAALGAELVYFREDGRRHTLLTIAAPLFLDVLGCEKVRLVVEVRDLAGALAGTLERELGAGAAVFVDSREVARELPAAPSEGAWVVWVVPLTPALAETYWRTFAMVDWFSDDGELASLHTDQSVRRSDEPLEWTEIVVVETSAIKTSLVVVNGAEPQPAGSVALTLENRQGEQRSATYAPPMSPFSVHRIALGELVPGLVAFGRGEEITITGTFSARGVFTRPYVMTEGELVSAYHGGNRYRMKAIPGPVHRTFPYADAAGGVPWEMVRVAGQKEMNPAYAVHRPTLTTRLHLFQSHGDLPDDFAVDATLYDTSGRVIAHRERWAVAPRHGSASHDLSELTSGAPFEGHVALRFSEAASHAFPGRLQALLEYRTPASVARTMLWSDRWNAPDRLVNQSSLAALYRVASRGPRMSTLAITNPGVGLDYDCEAPYEVRLATTTGTLVHRGVLGPHATVVASIAQLFPERPADEIAIATVESRFDLASMHLTRDERSGAVAAEHLMAIMERTKGGIVMPCGA